MKIEYRKRFLKELSRIPSEKRRKIEKFVFEELPKAESLSDTGIIEQMKGYRFYYKARFGSYRIGMKIIDNTVILERALHRRDIYRFFP